jgi:hypothetical protein
MTKQIDQYAVTADRNTGEWLGEPEYVGVVIAEAVALGGGNLCAVGHDWESEGGRTCPKYEAAGCSQTVYVCRRCGESDYGDKGGPAHRECFSECRRDFADEIAEDAYIATETAKSTAAAMAASVARSSN